MRPSYLRTLGISLVFIATACGGDATGNDTPVDVTGTWGALGTISGGGTAGFTLTVTQSATATTGTAAYAAGNKTFTVTGSVSGKKWTFEMVEPAPCSGSFTGEATIGDKMQGTLGGTDCSGGVSMTFTATKQH